MASAAGQRKATVFNAGELFRPNQAATTGQLMTQAATALGNVGQGRDSAVGALQGNADLALGALGTGYTQARNDVAGGYGQARTDTQTGIDLFNPWVQAGQAANTAQSDFLGLNGAAGSGAQQQALDTWRNATGYQDVLNSTTDAALRKASAIGGLGGNQIDELGRIGGQLANQTGQQYFGNLGSLSQTGLQAAGQQQQGYGQLAQLGVGQGNALAGLSTGLADRQAGIYSNLGSSLGNVFTGTGAQEANINTGLGNSLNQLGQYTTTGITGNVSDAGKAGDAAKQANQQTAVNLGTAAFSALTGMPSFRGGGSGGTGGMPANMGWMSAFAGT